MAAPSIRERANSIGASHARALPIAAVVASLVFLAGHLPFLASTLEDIDSVNFALGIHEFDPAKHQPHPPGYPIFMMLAKSSDAVMGNDARALAVWGALFGAAAAFPLIWMLWSLEQLESGSDDDRRLRRTVCGAQIALVCPLFWFTASRPMSDVTGLTVALGAQAVLVAAFVRQQRSARTPDFKSTAASGRLIVLGALLTGLALGFRAQAAWLTLPLLCVVILDRTGRGAAGALLGALMTFSIGVLVWAVPLVIATGGWSRYIGALGAQAGEDIGGVDLLVSTPTIRHLAADLQHTFIRPWAAAPLAAVVLLLAAVGAATLVLRNRRALVLVVSMVVPYLVFHVLFQETVTVRYALPILPFVGYLAVRGLDAVSERITRIGAIALATVSLAMTSPALRTYAHEGSPTSRAAAAMRELIARPDAHAPGAIAMHYAFARPFSREAPAGVRLLASPPKREWLSLVNYWREGNQAPLWFLADPYRTDLALIDPAARKLLQRYTWSIATDRFLSGIRPDEARWLTMTSPGWFLADGWAVTPETAGIAAVADKSPATGPIYGYLKRRSAAVTLMYGGRNLGAANDAAVQFSIRIDGRQVDETIVKPAPGFFLRMLTLAPGTLVGAGDYAILEAAATAADGPGHNVAAALEQFDLQPDGSVIFGFDAGWNELEYSRPLRKLFRWSSARSALLIHARRDVTLRIAGESPMRYFDAPPDVVITAGARQLARFSPSADFDLSVRIPVDALAASNGRVVVSTSRTFVPAERSGSPDRRQLGLRFFAVSVE